MDINNLMMQDVATCNILHPATKQHTDIEIDLLSVDSAEYRKSVIAHMRDNNITKAENAVDDYDKMTDFLVKATKNWRNVEFDGKELKFSYENCKMVYKDCQVIRDQVAVFLSDKANFLKNA
jgi:hypothetical protein